MKSKKFKTPLYGVRFEVIIYNNNEELEKRFKNVTLDPPIKDFDGVVLNIDGKLYVVFSADRKGYPTPGIIVHEAKHLVNAIFIMIGHDLDPYNDEPECYLLSWVVNRIHEML